MERPAVNAEDGASAPTSADPDRWVEHLDRRLSQVWAPREDLLPAYPAVIAKIQELVARRADLAELARAVGADSALAADVLRCANSAMYRRAQPIETLAQAVTHVGARRVVRLALASRLAARALAAGPLAPLRRRYWIDALAGAAICQELAQLRRLPSSHAFLLGLLHDFGKVVVLQAIESALRDAGARPALPADRLEQLAERHHVSKGEALAQAWRFPDLLQEIIAVHHREGAASIGPFPELVEISDRIVTLLGRSPAVGAEDLARLPGLRGIEERDALARLLPRIPEFIASFEAEGPIPPRCELGGLGPQASPTRPLAAPIPATVTLRRRLIEFMAVAISPEAMVLKGPDEIPVHQLLRVALLHPVRALEMWCLSRTVEQRDGQVFAELHPYALDGAGRARWTELADGPTR